MISTRPRCFGADEVTYERLPDQLVRFNCARNHDGDGPYSWIEAVNDVKFREEGDAGVTDELLDPLSGCVETGHPWVEYGIVEYRIRQRYPDLFAAHVRDRGHRMLGRASRTSVCHCGSLRTSETTRQVRERWSR